MMRKKKTVAVTRGDLFLIPLEKGQFAMGQLVEIIGSTLYVIVFQGEWTRERMPPLDQLADLSVDLAGLTLDARLFHGVWIIIGNTSANLDLIARPVYKVGFGADMQMQAESLDGTRRRPINGDEEHELGYRSVSSPMVLEDAVRARRGFEEWKSEYDEFIYERVKASASIAL